jgi:hypothetical protein
MPDSTTSGRRPHRRKSARSRARRFAAVRARQPMALVFGHLRLDVGQFPHLMPQRLRGAAAELRSTTSAFSRFEQLHAVAFVAGNQRSFMLFVAGLPTAFRPGFPFRRMRPGMWILRTGRQRGVLRRLALIGRSKASILAFNSALSASRTRMIAWTSGGWRVMISSVIPGDRPLLSPNTAMRCTHDDLCPDQFIENRVPGRERLRFGVTIKEGSQIRKDPKECRSPNPHRMGEMVSQKLAAFPCRLPS